jgi:regulatory factor X 1/2/3
MSHTALAQDVQPIYLNYAYVNGTADQVIYATTNGHTLQQVETVVKASDQCYINANGVACNQAVSTAKEETMVRQWLAQHSAPHLVQQDICSNVVCTFNEAETGSLQTVNADTDGATYKVQSNTIANPSSVNGKGRPGLSLITNKNRLGPVKWLLQNFEVANGMSVPRSILYELYVSYCDKNNLKPITAASLGKVISNVFVCLKARRLGKRGNTKYHYDGIHAIPGSEASQLLKDKKFAACQQPPQKRYKFLRCPDASVSGTLNVSNENTNPSVSSHQFNSLPQHPHQHLYLGDISGAVHYFPDIEIPTGYYLSGDCTLEDMIAFRLIYREHCAAFLDAIANFEFQTVENLWEEFWQSRDNNYGDISDRNNTLFKTKLYILCKCVPVQQFVQRVDYLLHQIVIKVLIPDVLMPIPTPAREAIQNFATGLQSCIKKVMKNYPEEIIYIKSSAASALAQTLRSYTSLNQLAQAANPILQNSSLVYQMLVDLNQIDFRSIQEQASLVCQVDDGLVQQLEVNFKKVLQQQNSIEQWTAWLNGFVSQVLKAYERKSNFAKDARQLFLKWSFCTSMVIRDLALKNAASFGSFFLIRLLLDEYMFYIIEKNVVMETERTLTAVKGEHNNNLPDMSQPAEAL